MRGILLVVAMTAIAAIGTDASAAGTWGACDAADVVAKALPAIVNITVVKLIPADDTDAGKAAEDGQSARTASSVRWEDHASDNSTDDQVGVFVGSGAVIDPSGIIVTNKHVIQDAAMISVIFHDKREVPAQLIAAANLVDLAVLKVNLPGPLPALQFGDSDALRVAQPVIAVGNPLGIGTSVSTGVVSALNRDLMRSPVDDYIQTDASINPGNSGGPLLDCTGAIVGINSALYSNNKNLGSIGIGFAIPSKVAKFVAGRLRDPATAVANWIGLRLQDLSPELAMGFGQPDLGGAIVTGVDPHGPAALASLKPGDIITNADGEQSPDSRAILGMVIMKPSGEPIPISVWRNGSMRDITLRSQPWPHMVALRSEVLASAAAVARAEERGLCRGLHLTTITAEDRKRFDLTDASGVLVDQVTPGSQAATMGLVPGDVIEQVGGEQATTPEQIMGRLLPTGDAVSHIVPLLVRSKSAQRWIPMHVGRVDVTALLVPESPLDPGSAHNAVAAGPPRDAVAAASARNTATPGSARDATAPAPVPPR
jgi:serine protease Do